MGKEAKHKYNFDLTAVLLIWLFFWWYFYSLAPAFLATYGQSTAIVRLGLSGGNLDAPIFGVLLRLIHGLAFLPLAGYHLAYLLSAGLAAGGLGLFYVWLSRVEDGRPYSGSPLSFVMKITAVVMLSQTMSYKVQAVFLERYMLTGVLLVVVWLSTWSLYYKVASRRLWLLYSIALAVGLTMHWIFAVMVLFGTAVWYKKPAAKFRRHMVWPLIWLVGVVAAGCLIALSLPFSTMPPQSYNAPTSLPAMISAYGKSYFVDGWIRETAFNPAFFIATAEWLGGGFIQMIGRWGFVFGLLGMVSLFTGRSVFWRWYVVSFGAAVLVPVLAFSPLTAQPEVVQLFSLLWLLYWVGFIWVFLTAAADRIFRALCVLHRPQKVWYAILLIAGIGISSWLILGRALPVYVVDEEKIITAIIDQLPAKAVLLCFDDSMCASVLYTLAMHPSRSDLTIIPYDYHPDYYVANLEAFRPFQYRQYPYILHEILATALHDEIPVFSLAMSDDYWRFLGFDLGVVHYIPRGDFGELALVTPKDWPDQPPLSVDLPKNRSGSMLVSPMLIGLIDARVIGAMVDFKSDRYEVGYDAMNTTAAVVWQLPKSEFTQFLSTRAAVENQVRNPLFAKGQVQETADDLLKFVPLYIERGLGNRAAELCRGALMLEPTNKLVRLKVADYYDQLTLTDFARIERANAALLSN